MNRSVRKVHPFVPQLPSLSMVIQNPDAVAAWPEPPTSPPTMVRPPFFFFLLCLAASEAIMQKIARKVGATSKIEIPYHASVRAVVLVTGKAPLKKHAEQ